MDSSSEFDEQILWDTVPGQDPDVYPQPVLPYTKTAQILAWTFRRKWGMPGPGIESPPHEGVAVASRGWYAYLTKKGPDPETLPVLHYYYWNGHTWGAWHSSMVRFAVVVVGICGVILVSLFTINGLGGFDKKSAAQVTTETTILASTLLDGTSLEGKSIEEIVETADSYKTQVRSPDEVSIILPADDLTALAASIAEKRWYSDDSAISITYNPYNDGSTQNYRGSCAPYLREFPAQQREHRTVLRCEILANGVVSTVQVWTAPSGEPSEVLLVLNGTP